MPSAATPIAATAAGRGLASAALPRSSGTIDVMMDVGDPQPPQGHASDRPSPQHRRPAWFSVRDAVMTELIASGGHVRKRSSVASHQTDRTLVPAKPVPAIKRLGWPEVPPNAPFPAG